MAAAIAFFLLGFISWLIYYEAICAPVQESNKVPVQEKKSLTKSKKPV